MSKHPLMTSPRAFFKGLVRKELDETKIHVSSAVKNYLCELLQFYIYSDHLFSEVSPSGKKEMKTLAEMYFTTQDSKINLKRQLKKMGDTSLYISGFLRDFLKRKPISVDYYMNMGSQAYGTLADLDEKDLFEELASRFPDLVFILFRIQKKNTNIKYHYILSLLDYYMDTGSKQTSQELIRQGIHVPFKNKGSNFSSH